MSFTSDHKYPYVGLSFGPRFQTPSKMACIDIHSRSFSGCMAEKCSKIINA